MGGKKKRGGKKKGKKKKNIDRAAFLDLLLLSLEEKRGKGGEVLRAQSASVPREEGGMEERKLNPLDFLPYSLS